MFFTKRKAIILIIICSIFFILTYNDVKSKEFKIISGTALVTDGDTIKINKNKIRLLGIDAPELNQYCYNNLQKYPCGKASKEWLKMIINNSEISCLYSEKDRYKRILGICYLSDADSLSDLKKIKLFEINSLIVRSGNALAYRKYSKKYIDDEDYARINKKGIWIGKFDMPWDFRRKK